jgi:hypothetical protein
MWQTKAFACRSIKSCQKALAITVSATFRPDTGGDCDLQACFLDLVWKQRNMMAGFHRACLAGVFLGLFAFVGASAEDIQLQGREEYALPCKSAPESDPPSTELVCVLALRPADAEHSPAIAAPPLTAQAPGVQVGGYNQTALRQQYGRNFGISAKPERPAPTYGAPITRP